MPGGEEQAFISFWLDFVDLGFLQILALISLGFQTFDLRFWHSFLIPLRV